MEPEAEKKSPNRVNVFLSWSGEVSHRVARALKEWLPNEDDVIKAVKKVLYR